MNVSFLERWLFSRDVLCSVKLLRFMSACLWGACSLTGKQTTAALSDDSL